MAGEIIIGQLCTEHRYTKTFKGSQERGTWPTTCAVTSSKWLEKSLSDTCALSTSTRKFQKATGNEETGQPLCSQIRQVAWEIIVEHLCTKYMYTQITKGTGNRETDQPHMQSNRAVGCGNHYQTTNCFLCTCTPKHLKASRNGKTGRAPVKSNRAGGCENHCRTCALSTNTQISKGNLERGNWPTTNAVKTSKWLGKSLSNTCVLSTSTRTFQKAIGNRKTGLPPM
ncbi:hypothetical protein L3X38_011920 [Prunus dulcis]|uniref:Uncharacterized protein n=1 Tax=Prunus dulcis TaxID=3755 RepID=A0AAD4WIA6_PRUDU|nr:hypothetical protein L3X38_011920 [Prunus dulcis]